MSILSFISCERKESQFEQPLEPGEKIRKPFTRGINEEPDTSIFNMSLTEAESHISIFDSTFEFNIFKELISSEEPTENIFISPLSIKIVLAMLYNGAVGETRDGIAQTLNLQGIDIDKINESFFGYLAYFNAYPLTDDKIDLDIANSLWINKSFGFKEKFLNVNRDYYASKIATLRTAEEINDWVNEKTRGKIDSIVDPNEDVTMYAAIILNAIYFLGQWQEEFDETCTHDGTFYLLDGSTKQSPMMHCTRTLRCYNIMGFQDSFKALEIPYGNGGISMYIFLPKYLQ